MLYDDVIRREEGVWGAGEREKGSMGEQPDTEGFLNDEFSEGFDLGIGGRKSPLRQSGEMEGPMLKEKKDAEEEVLLNGNGGKELNDREYVEAVSQDDEQAPKSTYLTTDSPNPPSSDLNQLHCQDSPQIYVAGAKSTEKGLAHGGLNTGVHRSMKLAFCPSGSQSSFDDYLQANAWIS
ncbi:hypothetical protein EST38_g2539 [Candolleomyces aberdarensis]|uniref:Uncharacterized protein n=1 Tax=Candolleomyces aberdarensis TaxID=2316362 RepID=A0A4Q2DSS2_9AGAR|nr:hypothetical protein EST38_g2539 [Candolleomyces aberdarensis]